MPTPGRRYACPNRSRRQAGRTHTVRGMNFDNAEDFIWRNARLIDRLRFQFHFHGGSADAVVAALRPYRNADGGFGNALEPDIRDPSSQTIPTWEAFKLLDEIGRFLAEIEL